MNLETPEIENAFDTEVAAVDVITKEKVARFGRVTSNLEKLHQIVVLAVYIATDCYRGIHLKKVGLCSQKLGTLSDNEEGLLVGQATLTVEVLLEESNVGLLPRLVLIELFVGRLRGSGCLDIYSRGC